MDALPRPARPLAAAIVSSALAAAFLNLGLSALDHPRALASAAALGLALGVGFAVLLVAGAALLGSLQLVGARFGLVPPALRAAAGTLLVLGAALAPLVEVGLREATRERAAAVLALAAGCVLASSAFVYALVARRGLALAGQGRAPGWPGALALGPAVLGLALWANEYHVAGPAARVGLGLALLIGLGLALRARRAASAPILAASTLLVLLGALPGAMGAMETGGAGARPATSDRPPVVLLTVDTLRADRLQGEARVPTPAIDRLAADSVVFTDARSAAPWTKPSLSTLLTGLAPTVHGMTNRRARLPDEVETLAERLARAGYLTAGIGLNAHLERAFRLDQGFQDYAFPARPDWGVALGARVLERLAPARYPELFPSTAAIADVAVDWLHAHADEPFFLWVHVLDPHWPYEPPPEWVDEPARAPRRWGDPTMVTNVQAGNTKPGAAERERVQELYAGEIRYVDAELARVLDALRELGLYERALIVFASDHGEEFWEHGRYEHGHTLYDEVLRVPLSFKLPGGGACEHVDAPVTTAALVPTVLDVLGLEFAPELLSARSLAPWWNAPGGAAAEPLFATGTYYFGEKRGVVFDGLKLVLELDTGRVELYDLAADPRELHSLAAARRADVERGLELIRGWDERCRALRERLGIDDAAQAAAGDEVDHAMRALGYAGTDEAEPEGPPRAD